MKRILFFVIILIITIGVIGCNKSIDLKDKDGNTIKVDNDGVETKDKDGNTIKVDNDDVEAKDKDGNTIKVDTHTK